ncbi:MAG TPA: hypothetical protein VGX68_21130 [Thermoanaerobaculia bacterium]|jgi:hypothetical protein|nr:hypothetical protein [Thermoanaerobaculia bacterium]
MKRISGLTLLFLFGLPCLAAAQTTEKPQPIRDVIARFLQPDWPTVHRAKWELESRQKEAIPELIALLDPIRCHVNPRPAPPPDGGI